MLSAGLICARKAAALKPRSAKFNVQLGLIHFERGEIEIAKSAFQRTIEIDASNGLAWHMLAHITHQEGRIDEALEQSEKALSLGHKDAEDFRAMMLWRWESMRKDLERVSAVSATIPECPIFSAGKGNLCPAKLFWLARSRGLVTSSNSAGLFASSPRMRKRYLLRFSRDCFGFLGKCVGVWRESEIHREGSTASAGGLRDPIFSLPVQTGMVPAKPYLRAPREGPRLEKPSWKPCRGVCWSGIPSIPTAWLAMLLWKDVRCADGTGNRSLLIANFAAATAGGHPSLGFFRFGE